MQYFDHSTNASNDLKVMGLRIEQGGAAVDAYWYVIEQIHGNERPLCVSDATALRVHCHTLCVDVETLEKWCDAMVSVGLLEYDEKHENLTSARASKNVRQYREKKEKASSAAQSRWSNADAKRPHKRTQSKTNAVGMPTKQNKTKVSSALASTTKPNASAGAAAADAAPPPRRNPLCPMCGVKAWRNEQSGKYECPQCLDVFDAEKVRWA